jgi:hypothetical protein
MLFIRFSSSGICGRKGEPKTKWNTRLRCSDGGAPSPGLDALRKLLPALTLEGRPVIGLPIGQGLVSSTTLKRGLFHQPSKALKGGRGSFSIADQYLFVVVAYCP